MADKENFCYVYTQLPGTFGWVAYSFLHCVVDSDGLTHDVIEIGGQWTHQTPNGRD